MPKLIAPHGASWRGRALGPGEIIDVSDAEALQLTAHGFRKVEQDYTGTADILSASALPERSDADGPAFAKASAGLAAGPSKLRSSVEGTFAVPVTPPLPRKDLLKLLKGRGLGNLFVKSTEELRALAAVVLAGEAIVEANHGRE